MSDLSSVAVIVVSPKREDAETVSRTLRNGGTAAHCTWVANPGALPQAVPVANPELLFVVVGKDTATVAAAAAFRDQRVPNMSVIAIGTTISEKALALVQSAGAQDMVTLAHESRLQIVAERELSACRAARAQSEARSLIEDYQRRVDDMVAQSSSALVYTEDGIILGVNPAALELLAYADDSDVVGTMAMDLFEQDSQAAIKGALNACANGKWTGHCIRSRVQCTDGSSLPVEVHLEEDSFDGNGCIRIDLDPSSAHEKQMEARLVATTSNDPLTSFYYRRNFFDSMIERLKATPRGGVMTLVHVRPDSIDALHQRVGPIATDQCLLEIAHILQALVKPDDIFGQLAGGGFLVLLARGNLRDVRAWAEHLRTTAADRVFEAGNESLTMTTSIGVAVFDRDNDAFPELFTSAHNASGLAAEAGGDRIQVHSPDATGRMRIVDDTRAVAGIKTALKNDGFRLVYQPIASLQERNCDMFDVLVRMVDTNNREIMPAQFLPAAERNGLMRAIDRWVLANAAGACVEADHSRLFVRLSNESLSDSTLVPWFGQHLKKLGIDPARLVIQVTESDVETHIRETQVLSGLLGELGCGFAVEHFGVGTAPLQIIEHIGMEFLKIDGSIMQSLAHDRDLQEQVQTFVEAAEGRGVRLIAERVEDANTMAVLFQLGVELIQGYYVQGPEVVLTG